MHISEINIYPIKSLKRIALQSSAVEARGLEFDRRWLIVDKDGQFLTQREVPKMATVNVAVRGDALDVWANGSGKLSVEPLFEGERVTVEVWGTTSEALSYDVETNEWFSDALEKEVRLLYMPDDAGREINPKFNKGGERVSFADGYPLLVIGEASLADLNLRLAENFAASTTPSAEAAATPPVQGGSLFSPLPMNRFRPNIVVSGSEAFAEDGWKRFRVGEAVFRSTKPCARCVMTTVDQIKGEFDGKEPLKTLASYRMAKDVIPDTYESLGMSATAVLFGQNLIPETPGATIRVGDIVEVIESY